MFYAHSTITVISGRFVSGDFSSTHRSLRLSPVYQRGLLFYSPFSSSVASLSAGASVLFTVLPVCRQCIYLGLFSLNFGPSTLEGRRIKSVSVALVVAVVSLSVPTDLKMADSAAQVRHAHSTACCAGQTVMLTYRDCAGQTQ